MAAVQKRWVLGGPGGLRASGFRRRRTRINMWVIGVKAP